MTTELLTDPGHSRADLQMIRTAVRRGYEIPDELLAALPKIAGALMLDKTQRGAVRLKAIETLMAMKEANDRMDERNEPQKAIEHHHTHELGPVTADNLAEHKRRLLADLGQ